MDEECAGVSGWGVCLVGGESSDEKFVVMKREKERESKQDREQACRRSSGKHGRPAATHNTCCLIRGVCREQTGEGEEAGGWGALCV